MSIKAKFPGICRACGGQFRAGTEIEWSKQSGSRHVTCPSTIVHSDVPLNSPGRGALQGRGRGDFFVGERTDIVRCYVQGGKPTANVPTETIHDRGTKATPQDRYITCVGMGAHWVSQDEADDFDLIGTDGSFSAHWSVTYHYRLATTEEAAVVQFREAEEQRKRDEAERAAQEQAAIIVTQVMRARAKIAELLPLGIRPLTAEEHDGAWASIMTAQGHKWEKDRQGREVMQAELVLSTVEIPKSDTYDWRNSNLGKAIISALGGNWNRLPAMPGNDGLYGWTAIYRWRDRYVVLYVSTGYDSGGPSLQGISVAPEDAGLLKDMAYRRSIKGYRFKPELYAAMVEADADGKLSQYGRGFYFGGTPSPCYDLPEAERACTKGAYGHQHNQTAAEVHADLLERFRAIGNAAILAILEHEDSVQEIH